MRLKLPAVLVLAANLCTGCTLIPPYSRPAAPVPHQWPAGPAHDSRTAAPSGVPASDLQWQQFFADARLQQIIAAALENNRDLRVAALNVEKMRAVYRIQRAAILPAVDATGSYSDKRTPADVSGGRNPVTSEQYNLSAGITAWEIDFFGRIRSLEQRALAEYLATEQARRGTQLVLTAEVAATFLTLAADRERLALARSTLASQQAAYDVIGRRHQVGLTPELNLRQAQTRVDAARVDAARFTELIAQDENALNLLVGAPVAADLLPAALDGIAPLPDVSAGTSSAVLLSRPDIMQAENLLKAANADIGAARAAFFPRITLTAEVGTASDDLSGLFQAGSGTWLFAPRVVMPIFDPRLLPALKASQVERQIVLAQYEKAIQTAFREVADALAARAAVQDQITAQQALAAATDETYRLANARYAKGIDNYLGVLDAQRAQYAAAQGLVALRLAQRANQVRLYTVLGGAAFSR
jgi:multidrug efflux system outer membrane protein